MAAFLYLARADRLTEQATDIPPVLLSCSATYAVLHDYFEAANLEPGYGALIDPYGYRVIDGYQLARLTAELEQALIDIKLKPERWTVLVGWLGTERCRENEIWRGVQRSELVLTVSALLALTTAATTLGLKLVNDGD